MDEDLRGHVEDRASPAPAVLYAAILEEGTKELDRAPLALVWSGLAGGISMGGSLLMEGLLKAYLPGAAWTPLVSKLGYSFGFLIVILGRQQLFTENPITTILPLLHHWADRAWAVARLWGIVLVANLAGTFIFAAAMGLLPSVGLQVRTAFTSIGLEAVSVSPLTIALRGVFAGWLIALLVWMLPNASGGARPFLIVVVTYVIGIGGFSHVIAGSVDALYLVVTGLMSLSGYLVRFALPALVGNVVGGSLLVALLAHGQVVAGEPGHGEDLAKP